MRIFILISFIFLSSFSYGKTAVLENKEPCLSSREFITAYRYLESKDLFSISRDKKIELSKNVARYCNGAANRFYSVSEILLKAGASPSVALELGLKKARLNDATVDGFLTVFKESFLTDYLDMDLSNALKLADSVTEIEHASADEIKDFFKDMFDFCLHSDFLKLGKPTCASFVSESLPLVSLYKKGSISEDFERIAEFMEDHQKLFPNKHEVLKLIKAILSYGPGAVENFIKAYQFATDSKGLNFTSARALEFASEMAKIGKTKISS